MMNRKILILLSLMMSVCAWAANDANGQIVDRNAVGQFSTVGEAGMRYYCETGSSTVLVLDANLRLIRQFELRTADGASLTADKLYFDKQHDRLLAARRENDLTVVYRVDKIDGWAIEVYRTAEAAREALAMAAKMRPSVPQVATLEPEIQPVDLSNPESVQAHEAYRSWQATHTALQIEKELMERYVFPEMRSDGGQRSLDAAGGPDAFGYSYKDSNEPDGPNFGWVELCGDSESTVILSNTDDNVAEIPLSVPFNFYGTDYASAFVSSNGIITFSSGNATFSNSCPFASEEPAQPTIAVNWDDHFASSVGGCNNDGEGPWILWRDFGTHVVIEWSHISHFPGTADRSTFQAILYPATGEVLCQYMDLFLPENTNTSTAGIDAPGAGNGLDYGTCNSTTFPSGTHALAVLYTPQPSAEPGRISVHWEFPTFGCVDGALSPSSFDLTVTLCNSGGSPCDEAGFAFFNGTGPGGDISFAINGSSPSTLDPGECADIVFHVTITPSGVGGDIQFGGLLSSSCGSFFVDFITISVPGCTGEPGDCGCTDVAFVVDVTGSMGGAIDNIRAELPNIVASAINASGGDVQFSLVVFEDVAGTIVFPTFSVAEIQAGIATLAAGAGGNFPEASDEALREVITHDALCYNNRSHFPDLREGCAKIIVLITDALPGGCDDAYTLGVDDVNAHQRALDALAIDAKIAAVYVPTFPSDSPAIIPIMMDYADVSNGAYVMVNQDGSGTGAVIADIIAACGGGETPDDCLPEGPDCNGGQPSFYSQVLGKVENSTVQFVPGIGLSLTWEEIDGAQFYQVYTSSIMDDEHNWTPFAMSYTNSIVVPMEDMDSDVDGGTVLYHVKAIQTMQNLLTSDIACWPFEEGSGDLAEDFAQDNDGTIEGADWVVGPSGHPCLHFGYGDRVVVENECQFYGQPLQVDACVSINAWPTLATGPYYIFSCHRYATWFQGFGLRIDRNGRLLSQVWNQNINNWQTLWAPNDRRVPLGVPFHVTAVINGNQSMLILNGEVVATGVQDYNSLNNGFSMTIGAHHYNDDFGDERYQYHMRGDIHWLKVSQAVTE